MRHGGQILDRMDRRDVEPGDGLHQNQHGLRFLLRRALLGALLRHAWPSLRERFRPDAEAWPVTAAASLAPTAHDLCEFDERPFSQGCAKGIHRARLRHHGRGGLAYLPGSNEALFIDAQFPEEPLRQRTGTVAYVVWGIRGERHKALARAPSAGGSRRST